MWSGWCANQGYDTCSVIRVHAFLEHWGLINFVFDIHSQNPRNVLNLRKNRTCVQEGGLTR